MKLFLLDVNVLIALAADHPSHHRAVARLHRRESRRRWGTCLRTGCGRPALQQSAVIPDAKSPSEAPCSADWSMIQSWVLGSQTKRLEQLQELLQRCHGTNQVNDAFLIWLAASHRASLLTFDSPLRHLASKPELVEVIT